MRSNGIFEDEVKRQVMRSIRPIFAVFGASITVACSVGDEAPLHAVLTSATPVSLTQLEGTAESLQATAIFERPVDLASTRLGLFGDSSVLDLNHATFAARPDGSVAIAVNTQSSLVPGDFIGKYRLGVCGDSTCSQAAEMVSDELVYSVTVVPKVEVRLAGGRCNSFCTYWLVPMSTQLVATSNVAVTWNLQQNPDATAQFQIVSSTPTRWEALLAGTYSPTTTATLTAAALQQPSYRSNIAKWTLFVMRPVSSDDQ